MSDVGGVLSASLPLCLPLLLCLSLLLCLFCLSASHCFSASSASLPLTAIFVSLGYTHSHTTHTHAFVLSRYPELYPSECLYNTDQQLYKRLADFCQRPHRVRRGAAAIADKMNIRQYSWDVLKHDYDSWLSPSPPPRPQASSSFPPFPSKVSARAFTCCLLGAAGAGVCFAAVVSRWEQARFDERDPSCGSRAYLAAGACLAVSLWLSSLICLFQRD